MHCVILEHVLDKTPDAGRSLIAQIHGEAQRHSGGGRPLTGATHAAAVAALRELPGGRPDLPTAADFLVSAAQTSDVFTFGVDLGKQGLSGGVPTD